jgi:hypothetical protein
VIISSEVEAEVRTRLDDLSPETLIPIELIELFFQSKDEPEDRVRALLEKAEGILSGPN